jgi:hypothetical protein
MEESEFRSLSPSDQVERLSSLFQTGDKDTFAFQSSNYLEWICAENDPRLKIGGFQSSDFEFDETEIGDALDDSHFWSLFFLPRQIDCQCNPLLVARLLRIFCQLDGSNRSLNSPHFIRYLENMLEHNHDQIELIDELASALAILAINDSFRNENGLEKIVRLLYALIVSKTDTYPSLSSRICKTLTNCCHKSTSNKLAFIEEGGVNFLLENILTSDSVGEKLRENASTLIRCVCCAEEKRDILMEICKGALIQDLVDIMEYQNKRKKKNMKILVNLMWAILNLTINREDLKLDFGNSGGFKQVFQVMNDYPQEEIVQKTASILVLQMCTKTSNRKKVGKTGGVRALMEILINFLKGRFDDVLEKALEALNRICTHSCNRKRVCEYGFNSLVYLLNETKQRRDIATQCVKLFSTLASGANDSRTSLRSTNLATLLQTVKNIYSIDNTINNEIQTILGKMFKHAESEYENSDDSSNTDSEDFFDNLDSKSSFSLSEGLSILKNSSVDDSLDLMQKKITEDYTLINILKSNLSDLSDTTREQEFEIQKLQKGLHSNLELVKERATLQALNRTLTKQLSQVNETLADQLINTTAQKEKSIKLDQLIAELQQTMETTATLHQTEMTILNKEMCELEKKEKEQNERLIALRGNNNTNPIKKLEEANGLIAKAQPALFHYLNLALKLNYISSSSETLIEMNYDVNVMYQEAVEKDIPHVEWPKMIMKKLEEFQQIKSTTSSSPLSSNKDRKK